jgi:Cys-tRNA(Pro) deacylase
MNNNSTLSKSAQSVQNVLANAGLDLKVIELAASTRTANDAASAIGCDVGQIVKSLVFRTQSNQPILVLVSGINRVNEKAIAMLVGEDIFKADADFTREQTGFAIGGIPPIGHRQQLVTLIDENLLNFDTLWAAAGTPNAVFSLNSQDLLKLTQGKVISVK